MAYCDAHSLTFPFDWNLPNVIAHQVPYHISNLWEEGHRQSSTALVGMNWRTRPSGHMDLGGACYLVAFNVWWQLQVSPLCSTSSWIVVLDREATVSNLTDGSGMNLSLLDTGRLQQPLLLSSVQRFAMYDPR